MLGRASPFDELRNQYLDSSNSQSIKKLVDSSMIFLIIVMIKEHLSPVNEF